MKKIDAFKCSDGKIFTWEPDAVEQQNNLAFTAIDDIMRSYCRVNPEVHYPALSVTLVPFLSNNAKLLIKALKLSVEA